MRTAVHCPQTLHCEEQAGHRELYACDWVHLGGATCAMLCTLNLIPTLTARGRATARLAPKGHAMWLEDGQRIHVGPQRNHRLAAAQRGHDAVQGIRVPACLRDSGSSKRIRTPRHSGSQTCADTEEGRARLYGILRASRCRRSAAEVAVSLYSSSGIWCSSLRTSMIHGLIAAAASCTALRLVSAQPTP